MSVTCIFYLILLTSHFKKYFVTCIKCSYKYVYTHGHINIFVMY